ncbi:MAG: hypothetical protein PHU23_00270 [Dehalococcoidales bacterium]|nr:hypothetical protein [Dehalococcoidales bacterium]
MKNSYHANIVGNKKFRPIVKKHKNPWKEGFREQKPVPLSRRLARPGLKVEP